MALTSLESIVSEPGGLQQGLQVGGRRGIKVQGCLRDGMFECQTPGMQGLAVHALQGAPAIQGIADQGVAGMGQVHPYLVCATGVQAAQQKAGLVRLVNALDGGARRLARLACRVDHRHALAVLRIAPDGTLEVVGFGPAPACGGRTAGGAGVAPPAGDTLGAPGRGCMEACKTTYGKGMMFMRTSEHIATEIMVLQPVNSRYR